MLAFRWWEIALLFTVLAAALPFPLLDYSYGWAIMAFAVCLAAAFGVVVGHFA